MQKFGIQGIALILVFGIGTMLKVGAVIEDKKVSLAEGVDTALYVAPKLPSVVKSAKDVVAEFKDLKEDELQQLKEKVMNDIRIDGVAPDEKRALWVINKAFSAGIALYELGKSFHDEIPNEFGQDIFFSSQHIETMTT